MDFFDFLIVFFFFVIFSNSIEDHTDERINELECKIDQLLIEKELGNPVDTIDYHRL